MAMRIAQVRVTPIAVPYRTPERWADGIRPGINNVVIELTTDTGLVGLGEATCGSGNSADPTCAVLASFAEYLVGQDPLRINHHAQRFYALARWRLWRSFTNTALAAIEMALWDIAGKAAGQPLSTLLGGGVRERIPVFGFVFHDTPDAMALQAQRMVGEGFQVIYFAVGLDAAGDEARVKAVREAIGPEIRLRIDANESWNRATAFSMAQRLAPYGIDFIEQPLPGHDIAAMADLRRRVSVPIGANQSCWTVDDVLDVVRAEAADAVITSLHWLGGIVPMQKCEAICRAAGIPFVRHSSGEMGIAAAAGCHVLATFPDVDLGNQTLFSHWPHDIIRDEAMALVDGCQPVPTGPGLGVELDRDKLEDFAGRYRRDGPFVTRRDAG